RRGEDGADQRRRVLPLPATAAQRQGDCRGGGFAGRPCHRRGGAPAACAKGGGGGICATRAPRSGARTEPRSHPIFTGENLAPPLPMPVAPTGPGSRVPSPGNNDIVLAFSGGLDTSFCVPWLQERGWAVHTVFADAGGVDAEERATIE